MAERIALLCMNPWDSPGPFQPFSYAAWRLAAALEADPRTAGAEVRVLERRGVPVDALVEEILGLQPDLVGLSAYMWSTPTWVALARRLRRERPELPIVMGGPSARPAQLDLPPHRGAREAVDALCLGEGEEVIVELALLADGGPLDPEDLARVPGLALPTADGWRRTPARTPIEPLDRIASPFQRGLAPRGVAGHLETFRGCPLSCRFCEWGAIGDPSRTFSRPYLEAELRAMRRAGATAGLLVDAALNLNRRGFANLVEAEARVGFLCEVGLHAEVYPSHVTGALLEFLEATRATVGVGIQSINPDTLKRLDRPPTGPARFEEVAERLAECAYTTIEIILGLPGDDPASFLRTLDWALAQPCSVRVFHCLALPDALLDRSPPGFRLEVDPVTLEIRSCLGWSAEDLARTVARVQEVVAREGGWWSRQWPAPATEAPYDPASGEPVGASMWTIERGEHWSAHRAAGGRA